MDTPIQNPKIDEKLLLKTPHNSNNWKVDRVLILEKIKELSPVSLGDLVRATPFSRSSVYYAIRDFEFAGLIQTKMKEFKNGFQRMIYFLKINEGDENEER